jgi:DNA-binding FrmR family transcriptional regulator
MGGYDKLFIIMRNLTQKQQLNRINYIQGHLRGIKKMIENDRYCIDVILQTEAVIKALKKINQMILEDHLNTCVTTAIKSRNKKERRKKIKELLEIYKNTK